MAPDPGVAVKFDLTLDDYRAMQAHVCRPVKRQPMLQILLVAVPAGVLSGVAMILLGSPGSFLLGFVVAILVSVTLIRFTAKRAQALTDPNPNGTVLTSYEHTLEDEGLRTRTPHWDAMTRWSGFASADETETHLFLMMDRATTYAFPKRAFSSPEDAATFLERVRSHLAQHTA